VVALHLYFRGGSTANNTTTKFPEHDSAHPESSGGWVINRIHGYNSDSWKLVDWGNPVSPEEESMFTCEMVTFRSIMSGKEANMCVYADDDGISRTIRPDKHLSHCDILPTLWKDGDHDETDKSLYYVEIGANIGSCVMEMLLGTNAKIIAFEPHPMNVYNIKKTVSQLDKSYQDRLLLFPIGLGSEIITSTIYSATGNMGNSSK
jgi:hypothetical protein